MPTRLCRDGTCLSWIQNALSPSAKASWYSVVGNPFLKYRTAKPPTTQVFGAKGTLDDLYKHLARNHPCIASVHTSELPYWNSSTPHAVVVAGMDQTYLYLNDPAFPDAPFQVPHGEFDLAWLHQEELFAVTE